jgi:hypothetical protein
MDENDTELRDDLTIVSVIAFIVIMVFLAGM